MGKAIWSGTLNFGLVNIDVQMYSAVKEHVIGFKLLHAKCKTPISYRRWCEHCKKDVLWQDIVKGLKLKDGSYFIITQESLRKLKPEKTDIIAISEFVDNQAIEPIYYNSHYYLLPKRETDKAYNLLLHALTKLKKIAVGQFVMKEKDHVCAIQPYQNGLLLSTLNYFYEIRTIDRPAPSIAKLEKKELDLAQLLINKLSVDKFEIKQFKDTFVEKLLKNISRVKKGLKIAQPGKAEPKKLPTPDLTELLKSSLGKKKSSKKTK